MEKYSFFEIVKYFSDNNNLTYVETILESIIALEPIKKDYHRMTHTTHNTEDMRSRYVNRIIQRKQSSNRDTSNPWRKFLEVLNNFFVYYNISDIDKYFDTMRDQIKNKFNIDGLNMKIAEVINEFLSLSSKQIFMNEEYSNYVKRLVNYLYENNRFEECIMWIAFISLYPVDINEDNMKPLINYWKMSKNLKDIFTDIKDNHSDLQSVSSDKIHSLSLDELIYFFESILDNDLGITVDIINQYIDERKSIISDELGIEADILQEDEHFIVALKDVQNILKEDNSYYICLKLLFFLPMYRIRTQELLKIPEINRTVIQNMRKKRIILSSGGYIILDYSYQVVFDYMKNVSSDFTKLGKFEEFSFLSSDYLVGQWKTLLDILLLGKRDILSDEEKKSLLSTIHFGQEESEIKKIYEQSILRREKHDRV